MRRRMVAVLASLSLLIVWPGSSGAQVLPTDPTGLLASDNVSLLTTRANPGVIGARFSEGVMYVTTLTGLTTYDISDPAILRRSGAWRCHISRTRTSISAETSF